MVALAVPEVVNISATGIEFVAILAAGIVPAVRLEAFRLPLKDVAVNTPVDGIKDNFVEVILVGIFPAVAVTQVGNTETAVVPSSVIVVADAAAAVPPMLKFGTGVVDVTVNGGVPVATVDISWVPETVLVALREVADATPKTGVVKVGLVPNTNKPEPVLSETTPAICAEVVVANWLNGREVRPTVPVVAGKVMV